MPLALRALLLILVALIPAALVQVWMEREARAARTGMVAEQAQRLARLVAGQQVRTIEGARQVLAAMAAHEAVRRLRPGEECNAFLGRLVQAYPRYTIANVFDLEGQSVCSSIPQGMEGVNVRDRWYFGEVLRSRGFVVGTYATGRASGAATIHLAAPLLDAAEAVRGVLVLGLSIPWLVADLQSLQLPEGSSSTIADREGTILARSLNPEGFVGRPLPPFAMALLERREATVVDAPALDGVRRVAAVVPVTEPPQGLFITLGLDAGRVLRDAAARDRLVMLAILGSLLLTFSLAVWAFGAAIERPVKALLAAAGRWGRQDWGARVGAIGGGREFARLAAAFDAMAEEVQRREAAQAASEQRLSALLDLSPQIVMTADAAGRVTWLNRWWHDYTGLPPGAALEGAWQATFHPEDLDAFVAAWTTAARSGAGDFLAEARIRHAASGEFRWHALRARRLPQGGWVGVGVEVDALRQAQAEAAEAAGRLRATYENAPVGMALLDRDLRFVAANRRLADQDGRRPEEYPGRTLEEMNPAAAPLVLPLMRTVLDTGQPAEEVELRLQGRTFLCAYRPVRDESGTLLGVTSAVLDISARKQAEEAERLLSREVDHRAKNALAVVRSLARLSLAESRGDAQGLVEALEGRISAMARVHTVLARERWVGAEIGELVQGELEAFGGAAILDGPPLRLSTEAAQPLTMVLHEMATNAAKYGALSRPGGHVAVRWRRAEDGGAVLEWKEAGGPPPPPDPEPGFGTRLVDANMGGPLDGEARFEWHPEGLRATLRIGAAAIRG
ncbi:PAS domain-containing protein [Roseococcus sp. DSY-14]|uniref:PAS domain-containing protein n=1 Tax=Roseococcus sp. DSY-14 TaxID=3369650 RepID=UPI00387AECE5